MKNQITPSEENYGERNEEVTHKDFTVEEELKTLKRGIDPFVFTLVLIFLLIDLIAIFNENLIEGSAILSYISDNIFMLFIAVLCNKAKKDPQYRYFYFFLAMLSSIFTEAVASMLLSDYLAGSNLYTETAIMGVLRAFICGYFYRSFKRYSITNLFG